MANSGKPKELSDEDVEIKRYTRNRIRHVMESNIPDNVKLMACNNLSNVYVALTGDDSLTPPAIIAEHEKMIAQLPRILEKAKSIIADKKRGTVDMLDGL